jgi:hypothetical protein
VGTPTIFRFKLQRHFDAAIIGFRTYSTLCVLMQNFATRDEWKAAGASEFCRAAGEICSAAEFSSAPGITISVPAAVAVAALSAWTLITNMQFSWYTRCVPRLRYDGSGSHIKTS